MPEKNPISKRICFAIPALSGGGAEAQVRYLANAFAERGYSVKLFHLYQPKAAGPFHNSVELVQLRYAQNTTINAILALCILFFRLRRTETIVTAGLYFDIIFGVLSFGSSFRWILRESNAAEARSNSLKNRLRSYLGRRASMIIANSKSGARYWADAGATNIEVVFNGYPDEVLSTGWNSSEKEKIVLCASRMQPHKRVDLSLRFFEQVFGPHPEWRFIVVGSGPESDRIDALIESSPISNRIERLNEVPQNHVFELMRRAEFITNFSSHEGTPNVIIEALAHGCVPILSDTVSHRDFFTEDLAFFRAANEPFANEDYVMVTDEGTRHELNGCAARRLKSWSIQYAFESYRRVIDN